MVTYAAKFGSIIRVTKKYTANCGKRAPKGLRGRLRDGNLSDFYKKSDKFSGRVVSKCREVELVDMKRGKQMTVNQRVEGR